MTVNGRWEKNEYIWECPGCGCVRCSKQAPSTDETKCLRCRAGDASSQIQALVDKLQDERDEWMARARKAERLTDEQCDQIYELQRQLKEQAA